MSSSESSTTLFSLENRSLKLSTAAEAAPYLEPLRSSTTYTEVRLSGNSLGVGACDEIAAVLSTQKKLQIANLADIFTARLLSEIPQAINTILTSLLELPELHTVNVSDNAFGYNTVMPLVTFLKAHIPLKHLFLTNNGMGPIAGAQIAEALSELADKKDAAKKDGREVPDLETIVCGRNRLESGSMKAWATAFTKHRGVKEVRMVQNGIRQDGIKLLLRDGLRGCENIRILDIQDNTCTASGAAVLAEVVGGWKSILELGLGDCYLTARGSVLVAEALGKGNNRQLKKLKVQYNDIDVKGVRAILSAATSGLNNLQRVELNGNKFSEDDEAVEELRLLLEERKEAAGKTEEDEGDDTWGLDDLSDLEEESDEEDEVEEEQEEEEEEEEEEEKKAPRVLKEADQAEDAQVSQKNDADVDELAVQLDKTGI